MSRELDARVAEAMGWHRIEGGWGAWYNDLGEHVMLEEHFQPSTDPTGCNYVRAECRRRGWCYEEAWYAAADGSDAEFWTWVNDFDIHHISEVSQEEAFCLAFLAAVEAEKGAKQQ